MGIVLAMAVAASAAAGSGAPIVGLQSDGASPCDTSALARDLHTLRPELTIVWLDPERAPTQDIWIVRLEGVPTGHTTLRVSGNPTPVTRPLPGNDCGRAVEVAASIVDGLLDQLPRQAPGRFSAPLHPSLGIWVGAGVLQGPIQWVPSFALGLRLALGDWEIVGLSDLGLLATLPVSTKDFGLVGVYKAIPYDLELGGGYTPRLGPGKLSLDALAGPSIARVWARGSPLFGSDTKVTLEAFVALAAGYSIDLPARFFVGARVEERWAPTQARFGVEGAIDRDLIVTRVWTFTSALFAGWRFF